MQLLAVCLPEIWSVPCCKALDAVPRTNSHAGTLSDVFVRRAKKSGAPDGLVGIRARVVLAYGIFTALALLAFSVCPNVPLVQWSSIATVGFGLYGPQMLIGLCGAEVRRPCTPTASYITPLRTRIERLHRPLLPTWVLMQEEIEHASYVVLCTSHRRFCSAENEHFVIPRATSTNFAEIPSALTCCTAHREAAFC
jgi:hypothetical protein